jgi:nuclear transport factor 2 (NTF2) superfamily protein
MDERIRDIYDAFNSREIDGLLSQMSRHVDWPNAWEGGRVHGREAVREYWTRQFAEIDPRVVPTRTTQRPDGRIEVAVHQEVRSLDGDLITETDVLHVYTFDAHGLVARMDVEP